MAALQMAVGGFNHLTGLDVIKHLEKIQSVNLPPGKKEKYFALLVGVRSLVVPNKSRHKIPPTRLTIY